MECRLVSANLSACQHHCFQLRELLLLILGSSNVDLTLCISGVDLTRSHPAMLILLFGSQLLISPKSPPRRIQGRRGVMARGCARSRFSRVNVPLYRWEGGEGMFPSMGGGGDVPLYLKEGWGVLPLPTPFKLLSLAPKIVR